MTCISLLEMEMHEVVLGLRLTRLLLLSCCGGSTHVEGVVVIKNKDVIFGLRVVTIVIYLRCSLRLILTRCHLLLNFY